MMNTNAFIKIHQPETIVVTAGEAAEARIAVEIEEGYHVQANPASDEFLVPVRLGLRAKGGVRPGKPVYPAGQPYRLEGTSDDLLTYGGTFEIVVPIHAASSARVGNHTLRGTLNYQACDDLSCLFPSSVPVTLDVKTVPASEMAVQK